MRRLAGVAIAVMGIGFAAALAAGPLRPVQEQQEPAKQPPPPEFKIPPEEAAKENPVKAEASSISQGKHLYETQCLMCHGKDGNGKGDLAGVMELKLRDYRESAALKDFSDGELAYIIRKGKDKMPGQEGRMSARQIWHMVNYIRSLAKRETAAGP